MTKDELQTIVENIVVHTIDENMPDLLKSFEESKKENSTDSLAEIISQITAFTIKTNSQILTEVLSKVLKLS
ncbi:MAG: hypothetical protein ACOYU3_10960 [Bacillota bacterium]